MTGASLPPERVVQHHRFAIIAHYWQGAVLCDRTALAGGQPYEGWMFIAHPDPPRTQVLQLPRLTVSARVGPGALPGDMPVSDGLFLSWQARVLVENVSTAGRPALGRPVRQAGTTAVDDRIDEIARTGGAGSVQNVLAQLDIIASSLSANAVAFVRRRLVAVRGTVTGPPVTSQRLRARHYAGGYAFVSPEFLVGTLRRGFNCFAGITDPFQRAVALMLLVTECHPFDDGNGRLARLLANSALSHAGQVRIVIPTVYRNNYVAGLAGVSNGAGRGETLVSVRDFAQRWTAAIDWSDFAAADTVLRSVNAYMDAGLADSTGVRLRMPQA